jgi:hypothetical protein
MPIVSSEIPITNVLWSGPAFPNQFQIGMYGGFNLNHGTKLLIKKALRLEGLLKIDNSSISEPSCVA